jgi:hypothetical protein
MERKLRARERFERTKEDLRLGRNPTDRALLAKLEACGVDWHHRYPCRSPACFRCRYINIRKQQRETVARLGHRRNEDIALVTVVLGATSNIDGVTPIIAKSRQDTRNCFMSARRRNSQWNDTDFIAWHEIDAVGAQHLPLLPPKRKALIPLLAPMAAQTILPTWLPTFHGLMFTNGLPVEEIASQFGKQWKHEHQVDVRMLRTRDALRANLNNIASYANKFHTTVSLESRSSKHKVQEPWPVAWETKFFGWLDAAHRNSFESLRMKIGKYVPDVSLDVRKPVEVLSPMPFIHAFTAFPMYNNTGGWR